MPRSLWTGSISFGLVNVQRARELGIEVRSKMSKTELAKAIASAT
jgi:non-homologous end joining protein Ku